MITYVVIFAFIGIGFLAAIGHTRNEQLVFAYKIAAWFFLIAAAIMMGLVVMEERVRSIQAMTDWMAEFGKLDHEARAAVAFAFPTMRYVMKRGTVRVLFEDTQATIEHFREFLSTSNEKQVSPRRDWCTKEKPEWAWEEIMGYLTPKWVLEDSYAGNHSWLWRGDAYRHFCAYWMAGRPLKDLNAEDD